LAGLEDLSAQSCRRHCVDGFVRSPDDLVSAVVWISDPATFPPRACVAGCDRTPERPLDCPSADRGLRLATDATVHRSRSGLRVWRCRHRAASRNGHTGSADLATIAMAERIFREAHRFDPTGVSRPCYCVQRTTSPPSAQFLSKILQWARTHLSLHKDAPIPRAVQTIGRTLAVPVLGGLHHQSFRA
jgi:hypothetical protein